MLESMIGSPDDLAFYVDKPVDFIMEITLGLVWARESFVLLQRAAESRPII